MAKSFTKRIKEIVSKAKGDAKTGRLNASFSRKFYDDVAEAVLNDPDYEFDQIKVREGKPTKVVSKPSKAFREKILGQIVSSFNVDAEDAKKFIEEYEFSSAQASTIYDIMSAINWEYMKTGKILRMPAKEDFVGAIFLKEVPEAIVRSPINGGKTKCAPHTALVKRSVTPPWCKSKA